MNNGTAKLIRKVAHTRGVSSPKKIRQMKRSYYGLSSEEKELQKIEWRYEVDDFANGIEKEYEEELISKEKSISIEESKRRKQVRRNAELRGELESLKDKIKKASFSTRFKYLMNGSLETFS